MCVCLFFRGPPKWRRSFWCFPLRPPKTKELALTKDWPLRHDLHRGFCTAAAARLQQRREAKGGGSFTLLGSETQLGGSRFFLLRVRCEAFFRIANSAQAGVSLTPYQNRRAFAAGLELKAICKRRHFASLSSHQAVRLPSKMSTPPQTTSQVLGSNRTPRIICSDCVSHLPKKPAANSASSPNPL